MLEWRRGRKVCVAGREEVVVGVVVGVIMGVVVVVGVVVCGALGVKKKVKR